MLCCLPVARARFFLFPGKRQVSRWFFGNVFDNVFGDGYEVASGVRVEADIWHAQPNQNLTCFHRYKAVPISGPAISIVSF